MELLIVASLVGTILILISIPFNVNSIIVDKGDLDGDPQDMYKALIKKWGYSKEEALGIMFQSYNVEFKKGTLGLVDDDYDWDDK